MGKNAYEEFGIQLSTEVIGRHLKLMFWGPTGSRKTETILRNFPHVLVADTEGNTDMVDRSEVPPFLVVKTKDSRKILNLVDAVAAGQIKFPDGSPVETFDLDSISVSWAVQQEVASKLAETRAAKYNNPVDEATTTQLDWVVAKRPLKKIQTRLANSQIKYLIFVARQKDLYEEKKKEGRDKADLVKVGFTWDGPKGLDYDMNAVLHFDYDEGKKWFCEATKVQGALKKIFPLTKRNPVFPAGELFAYADTLKPTATSNDDDEEEIGQGIAEDEVKYPKTQTGLINFAKKLGLETAQVGAILKEAGMKGFDAAKWDAMKGALEAAVKVNSN